MEKYICLADAWINEDEYGYLVNDLYLGVVLSLDKTDAIKQAKELYDKKYNNCAVKDFKYYEKIKVIKVPKY